MLHDHFHKIHFLFVIQQIGMSWQTCVSDDTETFGRCSAKSQKFVEELLCVGRMLFGWKVNLNSAGNDEFWHLELKCPNASSVKLPVSLC